MRMARRMTTRTVYSYSSQPQLNSAHIFDTPIHLPSWTIKIPPFIYPPIPIENTNDPFDDSSSSSDSSDDEPVEDKDTIIQIGKIEKLTEKQVKKVHFHSNSEGNEIDTVFLHPIVQGATCRFKKCFPFLSQLRYTSQ